MTYMEYIQNILDTRGRQGCGDKYCEEHHIIPKCIGGIDEEENLIDLYAREHFMAHKLLAEENPNNNKLIYAYWMMAHCNKNGERYKLTPEEYEEAKIAFSKRFSGENNPMKRLEARQKSSKSHLGKTLSQETRDKLSEALKGKNVGENNGMFGEEPWNKDRAWSDEIKQKLSDSWDYDKHVTNEMREKCRQATSAIMTEEMRKKISDKLTGRELSEEHRRHISESRMDIKFSEEHCKNIGKSKIGNKNMLGKHHSEDSRKKISDNNANSIYIYCPELDESFKSLSAAERKYGVCRVSIGNCIKGKQTHAGVHPITGEKLSWVKLEK